MKKSLSVLLSLIMTVSIFTMIPFTAHAEDNFKWTFEDGVLTISAKGTGVIDSSPFADYVDEIDAIDIKEGITAIGNEVFHNFTKTRYVTLPSTCKSIGEVAFANCSSLEGVFINENFGESQLETIGNYAFYRCTSLEDIYFPKSLRLIGVEAFSRCSKLKDIRLEEGLKTIGAKAFQGADKMMYIVVPSTVTSIGDMAFGYSNDTSLWANFRLGGYGNSNVAKTYCDNHMIKYYDIYNIVEKDDEFGINDRYVFDSKTGTLTITFPGNYKGSVDVNPESSPFVLVHYYKDKIKKVVIKNAGYIDEKAFYDFSQLSSVTFTEGLEYIASGAFYQTPNLKSVTIPDSVTYIGVGAFGYYREAVDGLVQNKTVANFTFTAACNNAVVKKYVNDVNDDLGATFKYKPVHKYDSGKVTATTSSKYTKTFTCKNCKTTYKNTYDKKANTLAVKGKKANVSLKKLKKKNQTVAQNKAFSVSKAQGKVTYKKTKGNKKITVNSAGKVTVKKGLKKGTYKVNVSVTANGNDYYKKITKKTTVTIVVK